MKPLISWLILQNLTERITILIRPWHSQIFNEPYDHIVVGLFNGITAGAQINTRLNDTIAILIAPEFLSDPDSGVFSEFSQLFEQSRLIRYGYQRFPCTCIMEMLI